MKTYLPKIDKLNRDIDEQPRKWHVIDANGAVLGKVATMAANILRGKNKPTFTPHLDTGDFVVVINAEKVTLSGNKWQDKTYIRHTGYPGGQRSLNASEQFQKNPNSIIEKSVKGMLPKNKLGAKLFKNLHVFSDNDHKFEAQKPSIIDLNKVN